MKLMRKEKPVEAEAEESACNFYENGQHLYTIPLDHVGVDTMLGRVLGPSRTPTAFLCIQLGCVCGAEKERKIDRKKL